MNNEQRFSGEWETKRLGELGAFIKGRGIKRDDVSDEGLPCVRYGELYTHYQDYILKVVSRIPPSVAATALPIKTGDLLFAGSGETAEEIGRCAAYLGEEQAYAGGDVIVLTPSGQNPIYLGHLMNSSIVSAQKARMGQGDAVVHIYINNLAQVQIELPPITEQNAIAEVLSDVDGLINALDALIAKKRAIKQATMQQLLTGKTRLPGFSGKWEAKRLGEMFTIHAGSSKSQYIIPGGKYIVVDMGSVATDGQLITSKFTDYEGEFLKEGDLVMPKDDIGGGKIIGKVAYINANNLYVLGDHVYALRLIEGFPKFFSYLINNYETNRMLKSKVGGSAQLGLSRKAVEEQEVPIPAYEEQHAIATVLSDMDAEIAALEQRRDKTRAIKQGMMQQLLTGRVRLVKPDASINGVESKKLNNSNIHAKIKENHNALST